MLLHQVLDLYVGGLTTTLYAVSANCPIHSANRLPTVGYKTGYSSRNLSPKHCGLNVHVAIDRGISIAG